MTHEGRGATVEAFQASTNGPPPRIRRREEGRIPHSFAPPLAYVFGVDVRGLLFFGHFFACNTADGA
jgi:hypothetical protein